MSRPDLNCIEQWNALVKSNYRKQLLMELLHKDVVAITPIGTQAIETVNNDLAKKIANAGLRRIKTKEKVLKNLV